MFLNKLSADDKYRFQYCENLQLPIQMQVYEKRKKFSQFFFSILESTSHIKHFEKRHDDHSQCVSEITDCEKLHHTTLQEVSFRNLLKHLTCESVLNNCEISMKVLL